VGLALAAIVAGAVAAIVPARAAEPIAFTVTMPQPADHTFHVTMRTEGLDGEIADFKMPAWTPGFYRILDYAQYVSHFRARDAAGHELGWEKTTANTWRVATGGAPSITLDYDVLANIKFGAQNYLDAARAYISPAGLYLYPAGQLRRAVTVAIAPPPDWHRMAGGLDPVPGSPNTFSAPDFDVLYDCPMLLGNQEALEFAVRGVPHYVAIENVPDGVDRHKMLADVQRIVEAASGLMGTIPYRHYTFLLMGKGVGGIEHLNSASISFDGASLSTAKGYRTWLSYVAHEYFHNFNVKRIRPLALGPFDYDTPNLTDMLWVSEGLTVYYEDIVLVRAGLETRDQYLEEMASALANFENASGHRYQSATESSLTTWDTPFGGGNRAMISYYNNGAMLGAMLDFKIRHESGNRASLDSVMRALYRKYAVEKNRGFTDAEFRAECENVAGAGLSEVFDYASTTLDPDYAKYFAYAGLALRTTVDDAAPGAWLGVNTHTADGKLFAASFNASSPAAQAGVVAGDRIVEVDGAPATAKSLADRLAIAKPGDKLKLLLARADASLDVEVMLGRNHKRTFKLEPVANPGALEAAILKDWLRQER
jgi:predicted metalloprotease with PDZ domain